MRFEASSSGSPILPCFAAKRRRLLSSNLMEESDTINKAKLASVCEKLGREVRVFMTSAASPSPERNTNEEPDDFYEFTAADYFRISSTKKEDNILKTRKIREAEAAARRSRITKAIIRVRFPDNYTLEAKFHPSETFQNLIDLLMKVIARADRPFYIYTTPPKKQIKDMSQDFFSAGFIPGAIVYFSYTQGDEIGDANIGPYLIDEIRCLNGIDMNSEYTEPLESTVEPAGTDSIATQEPKPAEKKPAAKPKWFKR